MSTGIFQLITNDSRQDRILMATGLLEQRLVQIKNERMVARYYMIIDVELQDAFIPQISHRINKYMPIARYARDDDDEFIQQLKKLKFIENILKSMYWPSAAKIIFDAYCLIDGINFGEYQHEAKIEMETTD